jgi:hypothetical protein
VNGLRDLSTVCTYILDPESEIMFGGEVNSCNDVRHLLSLKDVSRKATKHAFAGQRLRGHRRWDRAAMAILVELVVGVRHGRRYTSAEREVGLVLH